MDQYKVVGRLGEGAHGLVLRGVQLATDREVAMKKVLLKKADDGIPKAIFREIKTLQHIDCEYVMSLLDVFAQGLGFVLVFDYMPSGLWEMIYDSENPLTMGQIKSYSNMLLRGVSYLHENSIMHRDLKPANLLISKDGVLKIADLGLARLYWSDRTRPYSHQVATRWYRAPELLYGARYYNEAVDLWAVGCIIAEMLNSSPLFPGETDIEQLATVIQTLGTPTKELWPDMLKLPDYDKVMFSESKGKPWEEIIPDRPVTAVDIVKKILCFPPDKRLVAKEALIHPYFFSDPLPCLLSEMPKPLDGHRDRFKAKEYNVDLPVDSLLKEINGIIAQSLPTPPLSKQ